MSQIFVASFNRASDGAISKLVQKMKDENLYTNNYKEADYILAVGDRKETFDFVLERYRENIPIIHLWAGEISQGTHDEVYRHAMTLMSDIQLCTNEHAEERVKELCRAVDKTDKVVIVGNVMLDNIAIDESTIPTSTYDLVLYNPPTIYTKDEVTKDMNLITEELCKQPHRLYSVVVWIEPNGDKYSEIVDEYVTHKSLPREQFLGLLKNCRCFITNSSSAYYEAPFVMNKEKIIMIGERNKDRESRYGDMTIPNASDNIIKILKELK